MQEHQTSTMMPELATLEDIARMIRAVIREELAKGADATEKQRILKYRRLSVKEVAAKYGLSVWSVRNRIRSREIPFRRDGGAIYFIADEVENWLVNGYQQQKQEGGKS